MSVCVCRGPVCCEVVEVKWIDDGQKSQVKREDAIFCACVVSLPVLGPREAIPTKGCYCNYFNDSAKLLRSKCLVRGTNKGSQWLTVLNSIM